MFAGVDHRAGLAISLAAAFGFALIPPDAEVKLVGAVSAIRRSTASECYSDWDEKPVK
jgi:hypothetical protein